MLIKFSLIIPIYNESLNISSKFPGLMSWIQKYLKSQDMDVMMLEIIFAEDGSKDNSYKLLTRIKNQYPLNIKIIHSPIRKGKGKAFKDAFFKASGEYIILYDADCAVSPPQLGELFRRIDAGNDLVIGSRKSKKTRFIKNAPPIRFMYGQLVGLIAMFLFDLGVKDTQCGFKAFNKKKLTPIIKAVKTNGWLFDLEIILRSKTAGLKLNCMPVIYKHQEKSTIHLIKDPLKILIELFYLRLVALKHYRLGACDFMKKRPC
ncbi:MAG: glycosyltransferase [Promethearchaeota archaeon]